MTPAERLRYEMEHTRSNDYVTVAVADLAAVLAPSKPLLTAREREALDKTAELARLFSFIVGEGRTRNADLGEAVVLIHQLQHMIMAQAAARAYPREYRLLGEALP